MQHPKEAVPYWSTLRNDHWMTMYTYTHQTYRHTKNYPKVCSPLPFLCFPQWNYSAPKEHLTGTIEYPKILELHVVCASDLVCKGANTWGWFAGHVCLNLRSMHVLYAGWYETAQMWCVYPYIHGHLLLVMKAQVREECECNVTHRCSKSLWVWIQPGELYSSRSESWWIKMCNIHIYLFT